VAQYPLRLGHHQYRLSQSTPLVQGHRLERLVAHLGHIALYVRSACPHTVKINHLGCLYILGQFEEFSGQFNYDPENLEASSVEF